MQIPAMQPTTVKGIAAAVGVISAAVTHFLLHDEPTTVTIGGMVYGIVNIILPDNSSAPSSVETLVTDAINAAAQKRVAAAMPMLLADTMAAFRAVQTPAASAPAPIPPMPAPLPPHVPVQATPNA